MTENKVALEPCPFCGFSSQVMTTVTTGAGMFDANQCQNCGATGPYNAGGAVAGSRDERWNTRHRTRALEASQAGAGDVMREALIKCRDQFLFYAESHRAKETPDGYAKAVTNQNMAMMCEDALTTPTRIEASQPQEAVAELVRPSEFDSDWYRPKYLADDIEYVAPSIRTITPPQAAESGLLDEAIDLLRRIHPDPDYDTVEQYYAFLAKAGKPGEAGNG